MALNLNIGILGHVDSGKTSLAKILSSVSSTAAFDKNPQSQARGITLDLGFSSFTTEVPEHLKNKTDLNLIQYTLVDCPGHASLIKTIIGGAQIIDMMLLVIDVTKGIQTQTAECLVLAEITCQKVVIVFNKIDQLDELSKDNLTEKAHKKVKNVLKATIFSESPFVDISANPSSGHPIGIDGLLKIISQYSFIPERHKTGPFLFAVDHCFGIKGQGTVMTGTVLQGAININDAVDIPSAGMSKKIKSMQMFKKPVSSASQGDRVGMCVTQFDPKLLERGIVCSPGLAVYANCGIINLNKVKYFKPTLKSKSVFHVTVGYETTLATITVFCKNVSQTSENMFDINYMYSEVFEESESTELDYYLLLEFNKPLLVVKNSLVIGSKLDSDINLIIVELGFGAIY